MWVIAAPAPAGGAPAWVQVLVLVVGALGGLGGVGAAATVFAQRRKLRADAADVLTDTALELVEPLRARIRELEAEVSAARQSARTATEEMESVQAVAREVTATLRAWRAAILSPTATLDGLRHMVAADPGLGDLPSGRTG